MAEDGGLIRYCIDAIGAERVEVAVVLFFDHAGMAIRRSLYSRRDAHTVDLPVDDVLTTARDIGARAIVLAHNHPSGLLCPSNADIAATAELSRRAALTGIHLLMHILVTRDGATLVPIPGQAIAQSRPIPAVDRIACANAGRRHAV